MKRLDCLGDLSREHHTALSLALRARRAASGGEAEIAAMAAKVRESFEAELDPHFQEEERWLLPALVEMGESELVRRTLAEHAALARLVQDLATPSAETLLAFAEGLTAHVRFEERELFPAAETRPDCLERHRAG